MNTLVIDTNIIIAALIKDGLTRKILTNFRINFIFPEYGLDEIYKYKEEIKQKARLDEREFNTLLLRILKYVKLVPLDMIIEFKEDADKIMVDIHKNDSVFIATALAFNCPTWSDDKHFKEQSKIKIYTTKEMMKLI